MIPEHELKGTELLRDIKEMIDSYPLFHDINKKNKKAVLVKEINKRIRKHREVNARDDMTKSSESCDSTQRQSDPEEEAVHEKWSTWEELEEELKKLPSVKKQDSVLVYALKQSALNQEALLDTYCNPQFHLLLKDAFEEMKRLKPQQQKYLWTHLMWRWPTCSRCGLTFQR